MRRKPMLVGRIWELEFEGRSSISANLALGPESTPDPSGPLAIPRSPKRVRAGPARVPLVGAAVIAKLRELGQAQWVSKECRG